MSHTQRSLFSSPEDKREYLVLGCSKSCNHPEVHPDEKWVSLDHNDFTNTEDGKISKRGAPDILFDIGEPYSNPATIPKPKQGYKVLFLEGLPFHVVQNSKKVIEALLDPNGIIIINNLVPSAALMFAKECGFKGPALVSPNFTVIIAKNPGTDISTFLKNRDLYRAMDQEDIPFARFSQGIKPLPDRQNYINLLHLYDICEEYRSSRKKRFIRNFFRDEDYENCLQRILTDIENILTKPKANPEDMLAELKKFAEKHLDKKTFPNTFFQKKSRNVRHDSEEKIKNTKPYGYTMNLLLHCVVGYCTYTSSPYSPRIVQSHAP